MAGIAIDPDEQSCCVSTECLAAYQRELDYLFETLHRFGASARDVEDLAQEVFIVLHRKWGQLDTSRPVRPYLCGVAFRIVAAHRRRFRREWLSSELEAEDPAGDPQAKLEAEESARLLRTALDAVPRARRAVVVMHDLDGLSVAEIGARLSLSKFGVYGRLRKGRKELAAALRRLSRER